MDRMQGQEVEVQPPAGHGIAGLVQSPSNRRVSDAHHQDQSGGSFSFVSYVAQAQAWLKRRRSSLLEYPQGRRRRSSTTPAIMPRQDNDSEGVLQEDDSWLGEFLLRHHVRNARLAAGNIDACVRTAKQEDVYYRLSSLRSALSRPWFFCFVMIVAAYFTFESVMLGEIILRDGARFGTAFRFTALQERSGSPSTSPGVAAFGLIASGCKQPSSSDGAPASDMDDQYLDTNLEPISAPRLPAFNATVEGTQITLEYGEEVVMHGWYFEEEPGDDLERQHDPVDFVIESRSGQGGEWIIVGGPNWVHSAEGDGIKVLHQPREFRKVFDMRPPWQWSFWRLTGSVVMAVFLWVAVVLAAYKMHHNGERFIITAFLMQGIITSIAFIFTLAEVDYDKRSGTNTSLAILTGAQAASTIFVAVVGVCNWRRLFHSVAFLGITLEASTLIAQYVVEGRAYLRIASLRTLVCFVPLMGHFIDKVMWAKGSGAVAAQGVKFWDDLIWRRLGVECSSQLEALNDFVQSIRLPQGMAAQYNRACDGSGSSLSVSTGISPCESIVAGIQGIGTPGKADRGNEVKSLDQLLVQATGLQPMLSRMATRLADRVRSKQSGGSKEQDEQGQNVQQPLPAAKSLNRVIDKLLRAYHGKVSCLLDLCRDRIVLESVAELEKVLRELHRDPSVVIVRIKNYMHTHYDGTDTAGFRCIVVNLRIDTPLTRMLGIELHVCELQLMLRDVYEAVCSPSYSEMHDRYRVLRNFRNNSIIRISGLGREVAAVARNLAFGGARVGRIVGMARRLSSGGPLSVVVEDGRDAFLCDPYQFALRIPLPKLLLPAKAVGEVGDSKQEQGPIASFTSIRKETLDDRRGSINSLGTEPRELAALQAPSSWTPAPTEEQRRYWGALLVSQYLNLTLDTAGFISIKVNKVTNAMAKAAFSSSYFSSTPFAACMTNPWHRLIIFSIMIFFIYDFIDSSLAATSSRGRMASIYRFTALKERGGKASSDPGIEEFRLAVDGCKVDNMPRLITREGASITLDYEGEQHRMTGWVIKTKQGQAPEQDPVRYTIEAFDPQQGWIAVGGSSWYYSGTRVKYTTLEDMEIPMTRGVWMQVDPSIPAIFMVYFRCSQVIWATTCFTSLCMAYMDSFKYHESIGVVAAFADGVTMFMCGLVTATHDSPGTKQAATMFCFGLTQLYACWWVGQDSRRFNIHIIIYSSCLCLCGLVAKLAYHQGRGIEVMGTVLFVLGVLLNFRRYRTLQRAQSLVEENWKAYNETWEVERSRGSEVLGRLQVFCYEKVQKLQECDSSPRQYNVKSGIEQQRKSVLGSGFFSSRKWAGQSPLLAMRSFGKGDDCRPRSASRISSSSCKSSTQSLCDSENESENSQTTRMASQVQDKPGDVVSRASSGGAGGQEEQGNVSRVQRVLDDFPQTGPGGDEPASLHQNIGNQAPTAPNNDVDATPDENGSLINQWAARGLHSSSHDSSTGSQQSRKRMTPRFSDSFLADRFLDESRVQRGKHACLNESAWLAHIHSGSVCDIASSEDELVKNYAESSLDLLSPVMSLDQLYAQAAGVYSVFLDKVKSYAEGCDGHFSKVGGGFVRWKDVVAAEGVANITLISAVGKVGSTNGQIKWATLKSPLRAVEKLVRAYQNDSSRLLDLVRQSIIVDNLEDVILCLELIMADAEVVVVRIKNRLDPGYDGVETAGYRDVSINLRIDNAMTRGLGVETHVCELKILLKTFAAHKGDEGHRNYVLWRNMRGE